VPVRISPEEATALVAEGYDLVDVREPHEWAAGHPAAARHVPLRELAARPADHLTRDRVVFICGHGVRSLTACAIAQRAGLQDFRSVDGGVAAWAALGLPLER
jgi:rhodanese-related sulfurtransferase